jgi:HlyD family secretion protein
MGLWLRRLFWSLAALGLVGLIVWGFLPQPVAVDMAEVVVGPLQVTVDEDGKTRIRERYLLSAPLGGQMARIPWKPGDAVVQGSTVLTVIEPRPSEFLDPSAHKQAEAKVKAAESAQERAETLLRLARVKLEHAQLEYDRVRRLSPQRGVAEQEVQSALQQERMANEEVRSAQQQIKIADYELEQARAVLTRVREYKAGEAPERFEVVAPTTGRILRIEQESASVVTAGQKLAEIGDPTDLEVVIDVLSADAVKVKPGARMILEHWGGEKPLQARVRVVEPGGVTKISALGVEEQRVNVVADLVDPLEARPTLGDGFRVEARIVIWEKPDALKVPAGALFRQGSQWSVYLVEGGQAHLRPVTVGKGNGLETEILSGLDAGDRVIIHAGDRVKPGSTVVPRQ